MPDWRTAIADRLAPLRLDAAREMELIDELGAHLQDRYEELLNGGATEEQARQTVLRELNNTDVVTAESLRCGREPRIDPVYLCQGLVCHPQRSVTDGR